MLFQHVLEKTISRLLQKWKPRLIWMRQPSGYNQPLNEILKFRQELPTICPPEMQTITALHPSGPSRSPDNQT